MKVLTLLVFIIGLPGLLEAQQIVANDTPVLIDSSYSNGHYLQRLEFFKRMPDQKGEIVFLGNSITEGGKWQELINKKHVINRGISGDVTYGVIARLDEVLSSKPSKIFLLIGINDMKRGIPNSTIVESIKRIVKITKEKSAGTKLYIQTVLPVNEGMLPKSYSKISNAKVTALNQQIKVLCDQNRLGFIDLNGIFADPEGQLKKELSIDGLHLRSASYILWAKQLKKIKAL
jgi:lysophospholipase L1-like esterase